MDVFTGMFDRFILQTNVKNGGGGMPAMSHVRSSLGGGIREEDDGGRTRDHPFGNRNRNRSVVQSVWKSWRKVCWRNTTNLNTGRVGAPSGMQPHNHHTICYIGSP